jgi:uncharacterized membrane protein HdeD (DUF308 family)
MAEASYAGRGAGATPMRRPGTRLANASCDHLRPEASNASEGSVILSEGESSMESETEQRKEVGASEGGFPRPSVLGGPILQSESPAGSAGWMVAIRGALAIAFGIIALLNPRATAMALVIVFAAWAFIDAVFAFGVAAWRGRAGLRWGWFLFEGLVSVAAGIVAIAFPKLTLLVLVLIIAFRAIALGALEIGGAFWWKGAEWRWLYAVAGIVSILFGILLLIEPLSGVVALLWAIGIYAIIVGSAMLIAGIRAHVPERRFVHHQHQAPAPS